MLEQHIYVRTPIALSAPRVLATENSSTRKTYPTEDTDAAPILHQAGFIRTTYSLCTSSDIHVYLGVYILNAIILILFLKVHVEAVHGR